MWTQFEQRRLQSHRYLVKCRHDSFRVAIGSPCVLLWLQGSENDSMHDILKCVRNDKIHDGDVGEPESLTFKNTCLTDAEIQTS